MLIEELIMPVWLVFVELTLANVSRLESRMLQILTAGCNITIETINHGVTGFQWIVKLGSFSILSSIMPSGDLGTTNSLGKAYLKVAT